MMGLDVCQEIYNKLPLGKRHMAVMYLCRYVIPKSHRRIVREKIKEDPEHWFTEYHFVWGMWVRNALRKGGYNEKFFGIGNLDDIYVELVEEAVKLEVPRYRYFTQRQWKFWECLVMNLIDFRYWRCECHYKEPYGRVIMAGCHHD